ncbi:MAG: hypothetical protein R6U96_15905 [Promethearchaeia archaeon]
MKKQRLSRDFLTKYQKYDFSRIKGKKVGLVGSSRFKDTFFEIESLLQIRYSKLVCICSLDGLLHKNLFSKEEWEALQEICLKKLKDLDALLVLNVNNYIGSHTREEIEQFQELRGEPIYYLSQLAADE